MLPTNVRAAREIPHQKPTENGPNQQNLGVNG
ncbi:MAG: hypothetical protein ACI91Q_002047, partial [Gammaproteobacteria bacterium]